MSDIRVYRAYIVVWIVYCTKLPFTHSKPTKPTEDPNAYEKEEERRRQESLRRDREGDEASTKKPAAGQDEGEVEEGRVDPEEEEEEGHKEEVRDNTWKPAFLVTRSPRR